MVKGNWERRAELAAKRREAEKDRKRQRASGAKCCTAAGLGESVLMQLRQDPTLQDSDACEILCWLASSENSSSSSISDGQGGDSNGGDSGNSKLACAQWLRFGSCSAKRCRLPHPSITLSLISGVGDVDADPSGSGGAEREDKLREPVRLAAVEWKSAALLRFVAIGGRCVFDHRHPEQWAAWKAQRETVHSAASEAGEAGGKRVSTNEPIVEEDNLMESFAKGLLIQPPQSSSAAAAAAAAATPPPPVVVAASPCAVALDEFFLRETTQQLLPGRRFVLLVAEFLHSAELLALLQCSRRLRRFSASDAVLRAQHKAAQCEVIREASRQKKQQKKSKQKQANAKQRGKKDAFSRGGNTGN